MFKFRLKQDVKISISGEAGHVKGRSELLNHCDQYLVHYLAADGRAVDAWFDVDEIQAADGQ